MDLGFQINIRSEHALLPYLTLSIDADVQRVSLTPGAVYDCRRALCVEVVALC